MMNKLILLILIAGLICSPTVLAGDNLLVQFQGKVSHDLTNVWRMSVSEKVSYNDTGSLLAHETDIGFDYRGLADWLTLGLYFKYAEGNPNGDNWKREYRPHFNVTVHDQIGEIPWSNRTRIEYREFDEKSDHWRLRNKLLIDMPFTIPVLNATPYTGDEVFFNLSENGYNQNRLYAGLKLKPADNLKIDFYYYFLKLQRSNGWDEASVIGTNLTLKF